MAFGMNTQNLAPVEQEKVSPTAKLAWKPKGKKAPKLAAKKPAFAMPMKGKC